MSCSFWNMRRRLRAQQQEKDKIITDLAAAQAKEKAEAEAKAAEEAAKAAEEAKAAEPEKPKKQGKKSAEKAGAENDNAGTV